MTVILETPRLVLREMAAGDLDFIATMLADPRVSRYYERTFSRADSEGWLRRQLDRYRRDGHGLWLVVARDTAAPVGQVGLTFQEVEGTRQPEIGWLLHSPFWGRGFATEAASATRDAAFELWHYDEVISLIRPENTASQRVAGRIGMVPGRHVQFHAFDHIVFSCTRRPATGERATLG